jgi:hypothetical protein
MMEGIWERREGVASLRPPVRRVIGDPFHHKGQPAQEFGGHWSSSYAMVVTPEHVGYVRDTPTGCSRDLWYVRRHAHHGRADDARRDAGQETAGREGFTWSSIDVQAVLPPIPNIASSILSMDHNYTDAMDDLGATKANADPTSIWTVAIHHDFASVLAAARASATQRGRTHILIQGSASASDEGRK